jgi:hypothetical protein
LVILFSLNQNELKASPNAMCLGHCSLIFPMNQASLSLIYISIAMHNFQSRHGPREEVMDVMIFGYLIFIKSE